MSSADQKLKGLNAASLVVEDAEEQVKSESTPNADQIAKEKSSGSSSLPPDLDALVPLFNPLNAQTSGEKAALNLYRARVNRLFVDKGQYIAEWLKSKPASSEDLTCECLIRPRLFGKSFFLDTVQALYEGRKEVFVGTYLEKNWDWQQPSVKVIRIDLGSLVAPLDCPDGLPAQDGVKDYLEQGEASEKINEEFLSALYEKFYQECTKDYSDLEKASLRAAMARANSADNDRERAEALSLEEERDSLTQSDSSDTGEDFSPWLSRATARTALWQLKQLLLTCSPKSRVLLLDNLDAPLLNCMTQWEIYNNRAFLINSFLGILYSCRSVFVRVVATGTVALRQSEGVARKGNLPFFPMSAPFYGPSLGKICGFTADELQRSFAERIVRACQTLNREMQRHNRYRIFQPQEIVDLLHRVYGGYHFGAEEDVIHPSEILAFMEFPEYSLMNYTYCLPAPGLYYLSRVGQHNSLELFAALAKLILGQGRFVQPQSNSVLSAAYVCPWSERQAALYGAPAEQFTTVFSDDSADSSAPEDTSQVKAEANPWKWTITDPATAAEESQATADLAKEQSFVPTVATQELGALPYHVLPQIPFFKDSLLGVAVSMLTMHGFKPQDFAPYLRMYANLGYVDRSLPFALIKEASFADRILFWIRNLNTTNALESVLTPEELSRLPKEMIESLNELIRAQFDKADSFAQLQDQALDSAQQGAEGEDAYERALRRNRDGVHKGFSGKKPDAPVHQAAAASAANADSAATATEQEVAPAAAQGATAAVEQASVAVKADQRAHVARGLEPLAAVMNFELEREHQKDGSEGLETPQVIEQSEPHLDTVKIKEDTVVRQEQMEEKLAREQSNEPYKVITPSRMLRSQVAEFADVRYYQDSKRLQSQFSQLQAHVKRLGERLHLYDAGVAQSDAAQKDAGQEPEANKVAEVDDIVSAASFVLDQPQSGQERAPKIKTSQDVATAVQTIHQNVEQIRDFVKELMSKNPEIAARFADQVRGRNAALYSAAARGQSREILSLQQKGSFEQFFAAIFAAGITFQEILDTVTNSVLHMTVIQELLSLDEQTNYFSIFPRFKEAPLFPALLAYPMVEPSSESALPVSTETSSPESEYVMHSARSSQNLWNRMNRALANELTYGFDAWFELSPQERSQEVNARELKTPLQTKRSDLTPNRFASVCLEIDRIRAESLERQAKAFYIALGVKTQICRALPAPETLMQFGFGDVQIYYLLQSLGFVRISRLNERECQAQLVNINAYSCLRRAINTLIFGYKNEAKALSSLHEARTWYFFARLQIPDLMSLLDFIFLRYAWQSLDEINSNFICQLWQLWFAVHLDVYWLEDKMIQVFAGPLEPALPADVAARYALKQAQKFGLQLDPEMIGFYPEFYPQRHHGLALIIEEEKAVVVDVAYVYSLEYVAIVQKLLSKSFAAVTNPVAAMLGCHPSDPRIAKIKLVQRVAAVVCFNKDCCRLVSYERLSDLRRRKPRAKEETKEDKVSDES